MKLDIKDLFNKFIVFTRTKNFIFFILSFSIFLICLVSKNSAWPVFAILFIYIFEKDIKEIIKRISKVRNVELSPYVSEEIQDKIKTEAKLNNKDFKILQDIPKDDYTGAFLQSFIELEGMMRKVHNIIYKDNRKSRKTLMDIANDLADNNVFTKADVHMLRDIIPTRNQVVHTGVKLDSKSAEMFLKLIIILKKDINIFIEKSINEELGHL